MGSKKRFVNFLSFCMHVVVMPRLPSSLVVVAIGAIILIFLVAISASLAHAQDPPPDLVITNISPDPITGDVGQDIIVTVTVENQGGVDVGGTYVEIYEDLASAPSGSDVGDQYTWITGLVVGASIDVDFTVNYGTGGSYSFWAQVDRYDNITEPDENNNIYGPVLANIGPDLVITNISPDPITGDVSENIAVTVTVENQGGVDASVFNVDIYKNRDTAPSEGDYGEYTTIISGLAAGASTYAFFTVTYAYIGNYQLWALADSVGLITESDEGNNDYGPVQVTIGPPDLVITNISPDPINGDVSENIPVMVTVENQGGVNAGAFFIDIYEHLDSAPLVWQNGDSYQRLTFGLDAGASIDLSFSVNYDAAGNYDLWAQVDGWEEVDEFDEINNVYGPVSVTIGQPEVIITNPGKKVKVLIPQSGVNEGRMIIRHRNTTGRLINIMDWRYDIDGPCLMVSDCDPGNKWHAAYSPTNTFPLAIGGEATFAWGFLATKDATPAVYTATFTVDWQYADGSPPFDTYTITIDPTIQYYRGKGVPVFPNIYTAIAASFVAAILGYFIVLWKSRTAA